MCAQFSFIEQTKNLNFNFNLVIAIAISYYYYYWLYGVFLVTILERCHFTQNKMLLMLKMHNFTKLLYGNKRKLVQKKTKTKFVEIKKKAKNKWTFIKQVRMPKQLVCFVQLTMAELYLFFIFIFIFYFLFLSNSPWHNVFVSPFFRWLAFRIPI